MPISLAELQILATTKPPGTPLADILGVGNVYWSGSLADYVYLLPDVIGKPAAIVPTALKGRFGD